MLSQTLAAGLRLKKNLGLVQLGEHNPSVIWHVVEDRAGIAQNPFFFFESLDIPVSDGKMEAY